MKPRVATREMALISLAPNAIWMIEGNEIKWMSPEVVQPGEQQVAQEIARLQAEFDAAAYQGLRAAAYPSIVDQLDTLYHGGYDAWRAQIQAIKEQFPKPEVAE